MGQVNNLNLYGIFSDAIGEKNGFNKHMLKGKEGKCSSAGKTGSIQDHAYSDVIITIENFSLKLYQGFHQGFPAVMGSVLVIPRSSCA